VANEDADIFILTLKGGTMKKIALKSLLLSIGIVLFLICSFAPPGFAASVPGVTDDTIVIGITTPMTGPAALYAKCGQMYEAIFSEWGKNINGRNIKIVRIDDGCDPVKGIAAIKKLIFDDSVFMLSSGQCSNMCLAVKPTVVESNIPMVTHGCIADGMYVPTVKNIFNPAYISTDASKSMVDFAMSIAGPKSKIGIIRHTDEWATSIYKPIVSYLKEKYGTTPIVDVTMERGTADATSQALKLKQENIDAVIAILFPAETTAFLRDAHKIQYSIPIVGSTATSVSDQFQSLKSIEPLKKYFGPFAIKYPLDHPKVKIYEELLKKYFPETKFDAFAVFATGGPLVVIDALKKCGRDLTREKFLDILETNYTNWEPENYIGAVPLTFSKTDHVGMNRLVMSTIATGKFEIIKNYEDYAKLLKQ
jgi:branched-chain amino acid transport system substrate-binding protein